jgi:DNA invertase Pin-like site-specific DNA recombinase
MKILTPVFQWLIYSNHTLKRKVGIMTVYGYARVSTRDQDLIAQDAELMAAGCAKVFKEKISGAKTDRPRAGQGHPPARAGRRAAGDAS